MTAGDSSRRARTPYKWTATLQEDASGDSEATWAVQFALPPGPDHRRGGGSCWFETTDAISIPAAPRPLTDLDPANGPGSQQELPDDVAPPYDSSAQFDHMDESDAKSAAAAGSKDEAAAREISSDSALDDKSGSLVGVMLAVSEKSDEWPNLFATCNGNTVRIYRALSGTKPVQLQVYLDPNTAETFFTVTWTFNADGKHEWWLVAAGKRGILRVLNVSQNKLEQTLIGHGESINDLKTHPRDPALILSSSKDESLRLWNLRTSSTVAVFAGLRGHRGEVLYADFNYTGAKFASCGIDNSIRVWDVDGDEKILSAIKETHTAANRGIRDVCVYTDENGQRRKVNVPMVQFPTYVTHKVHKHYVDCVMWIGELLLSKSVHNRILLWEPQGDRESLASPAHDYTVLEEYLLDHCGIWFIRFGIDRSRRLVACGNERGAVTIFRLDDIPSRPYCVLSSGGSGKNGKDACFVRQCAFSHDGAILLAVDDQACIVQYERVAELS
jgi:polycomb protein EED